MWLCFANPTPESAAICLGSLFKGILYASALIDPETIQRQKGVVSVKDAPDLMEVRKDKEERNIKRDFRDINANSRAIRYQRFDVRRQEHSSLVRGIGLIELSNKDQIQAECSP